MKLLEMSDDFAPLLGTQGTVTSIDDTGSIMVDWDNGSGLNVLYGIDRVRKVEDSDDDKIREQILAIWDSGMTNMFDVYTVQRIALENGYYELVCYFEEHRREYAHFILTGEE